MPKDQRTGPGSTSAAVRRAALLIAVVIVWLVVGAVGGPAVGQLSQVQSNDNSSFLPSSAESTEVVGLSAGFMDTASLPFFVVAARPSGLTAADRAFLGRFAGEVPDLPLQQSGGLPVLRLGDYLTAAPVVPVPSRDGRADMLVVALDSDRTGTPLPGGDSVVDLAARALRSAASGGAPAGLQTHVTGPAGIIADLVAAFAGIDGKLLVVALVAVFLILLLVYRSPVLPFAVLLTSVFGLSLAALVVYHLAKAGHLTVSGMVQGILFILVVGASTDYSLLLVARYREELARTPSAIVAMRRAWRGAAPSICASAATVVLGLLCLTLSRLGSTRSLGPVGALGIVGALLSALTFLPVILVTGRWVFWPRVPRHRGGIEPSEPEGRWDGDLAGHGIWSRVATAVGRRPRVIWATTTVLLLAAAGFATTFHASGVSQTDTFRSSVDSVVGQRLLAEHFPAGAGSPAIVIAPGDAGAAVVRIATAVPGVAGASLVPQAAEAASGPASGDAPPMVVGGRVMAQVVLEPAADSPEAQHVVQSLRDALRPLGPRVLVGGDSAINLDVQQATDRDLRVIVPSVLLVIVIVLALLLRSLLAPIVLLVANVLSFAATLGISALVFNHLLDLPGADPAIPLYAFVFLVALGIDYSIFLMTRVREESGRHGTRRGVLRGLTVTGGVITSAGVVLAATFGALATLPLLFLLQIAFIVAFGVLLDTMVVRSLLVPSLTHDLGARVWWPGRLATRDRAD